MASVVRRQGYLNITSILPMKVKQNETIHPESFPKYIYEFVAL